MAQTQNKTKKKETQLRFPEPPCKPEPPKMPPPPKPSEPGCGTPRQDALGKLIRKLGKR